MLRNSILVLLLLIGLYRPVEAANRFAVCTVTCTWDGSSTTMWSTSTGGATGASVPGASDDVKIDAATCVGGVTCTITVNTNVTVLSMDMNACTAATTGCVVDFSVNNNNVTLGASTIPFNNSGTGTRTLNMGNGTWTVTSAAASNIWSMAVTTNLTFNANSSTIVVTSTTSGNSPPSFQGGGKTYNNVTIASNTNKAGINIIGSNTFNVLTLNGPGSTIITAATTQTITTLTISSPSSSKVLGLINSSGTAVTLTITNAPTLSWLAIHAINFTNATTATNTFDMGGNTNLTATAPSGGASCIGC